ncbi:hypothetical protein [Rhizobium leguminosarum]|uniref:hypothetical protein n=1 Tax=Rhizobium leguminosarum TaxID=384 RepID=UPI001C98B08F|nr:hypothetical protein [Rhizobium leguminosarum]MBY5563593.1 hypothetical protein [Rhizobium leguminosarum]MBY5709673.1 hypothetical protein [Rhizobium leguminosarum]
MKPVLDQNIVPQKSARPAAGHVAERARWSFSMRFWRQLEYFGVGDMPPGWFVSLFERMSSLCGMTVEGFLKDTVIQDSVRFHTIDWNGKNVPLRRSDFDWLPNDYLANADEYPFYQFHVSKALGRVVGFFDEAGVFNVLLLDPKHNIQPSKYNDYTIIPTKSGSCNYASLTSAATEYLSRCSSHSCSIRSGFSEFLEKQIHVQTSGVVICKVAEEHYDRFQSLKGSIADFSLRDVIEIGLLQLEADMN